MPLKLIPPRLGKTPFYAANGAHLGVRVRDKSLKTGDRRLAKQLLRRIERDIERGAVADPSAPGFAGAAERYMMAGGERRFLAPLIRYFQDTPVPSIGQTQIDDAANTLYPKASNATRNRQVYTPVQAILRREGIELPLRRPKGAQGTPRTRFLWEEQAFAFVDGAREVDPELGLFCELLLYTGPRLSEALRIQCEDVRLKQGLCYIGITKNGDPRPAHLTKFLVRALRRHPRGLDRAGEKLFRFTKSGTFYSLWALARTKASDKCGTDLSWVTPHVFCHTWGTWMRQHGKIDDRGLVATGRWRSVKSVAIYAHVAVSEESRRADLLPVPKRRRA
jgi:integrase